MLESTKDIGNEAYKNLKEAKEIRQEAAIVQQQAERKEQAIEPLYQQANEARQKADEELRKARLLREQQENLIKLEADKIVETKISQIMQGTPTKERERMRLFMKEIEFKDGETALDKFNQAEKELQKKLRRGMER